MKIKVCILFCLFTVLLLCGCDFEFMSPDNLVTAPASNQEKLQQKQLITSFLGREEHLIVPKDMDNTNAYQYIDLDEDGEEEIIAFYANKENNFMQHGADAGRTYRIRLLEGAIFVSVKSERAGGYHQRGTHHL